MANSKTKDATVQPLSTPTANYGWAKPTVGGDSDAWGGMLNADLDGIDSTVWSISTGYLKLTGGTLSGLLTANQGITVTGGSAAGGLGLTNPDGGNATSYMGVKGNWQTDVQLSGTNWISSFGIGPWNSADMTQGQAFWVQASAGRTSMQIFGSGTGSGCDIEGWQTTNGPRWKIWMPDATPETGSNAGSNFSIQNFDDSGAYLGSPFSILRANGAAYFSGASVTLSPASGAAAILLASANNSSFLQMQKANGYANNIFGYQGSGAARWLMAHGDNGTESGSNAGSNWSLACYADNGTTVLGFPISIIRSTQVVTFSKAIVNGPSDRTLKENIAPIHDALDKVKALQGVSFNFIATPEKREIGLIAQDVEPILPEIVQQFQPPPDPETKIAPEPKLALDYPKLVAVLIEAVKTLTERVEALEAVRYG